MLKFLIYENGRPAKTWPLRNTYLVGADGSAIRCEFYFEQGVLHCTKRESGSAALAMQIAAGESGEFTVQTCLLPEREEPYLLSVEMARHRLMLLYRKLEDWGMFDIGDDHPATRRVELSQRLFIEALCHLNNNEARADKLARDCLNVAIDGSEELALAHAELLLNRRKDTGLLPRWPIGCGVNLRERNERIRAGVMNNFDFVCLPTPWKELAVAEDEYHWENLDNWVDWLRRKRLPVVAGPIVSFDSSQLPDWIYIWEHDFETIRDVIYEHIEAIVTRYRDVITNWIAVSGLHINNHFTFTVEQLLDLTRMSTMLVKKLQPQAKVSVEICQPFGEYFARNQRSIPPMTYADLLIQGGIPFDGFNIKLLMGQAVSGQYTRDLMQLSDLLDQYSQWGKPLHVTMAAPSEPIDAKMISKTAAEGAPDVNSGYWRRPWSQMVQGRWLEAMLHVCLSKPYIEMVAWNNMLDHPGAELPLSGLAKEDHQPKSSFRRLIAFRRSLGDTDPIRIVKEGGVQANAETQMGQKTAVTSVTNED